MICFLPSSPGYAWVRRIDWMISRIFRSYVVVKAESGRRRLRTSCWVIVEAPRELPESVSMPAEMMPTGSKPALLQNVLSSLAVVASTMTAGICSNATTSRRSRANVASLTAPVRS